MDVDRPIQRQTSVAPGTAYGVDSLEPLTAEEQQFVREMEAEMAKDDIETPKRASNKYRFWAVAQEFGPGKLFDFWTDVAKKSLAQDPTNIRKFVVAYLFYMSILTFNITNRYTRGAHRVLGSDPKAQGIRSNLWEKLKAMDQCGGIIGVPNAIEKCWLCGYGETDYPKSRIPSSAAWQCEHILPLCAALLFFDVPQRADEVIANSKRKPEDRYNYALNYGWAHAECNRLKSSYCFSEIFQPGTLILLNTPRPNGHWIQAYVNDLGLLLGVKSPVWNAERVHQIIRRSVQLSSHILDLYIKETDTSTNPNNKLIFPEFNIRNSRIARSFGNIDRTFRLAYQNDITDPQIKDAIDSQRVQLFTKNTPSLCDPTIKSVIVGLPAGLIPEELKTDILNVCARLGQGGKRRKTRKFNKKRKMKSKSKTYKK
jgi:hypothetical protein